MVTRDGCPVAVYRAMDPEPTLTDVRRFLGDRQTVLDLGSGAGRIANPLTREGRIVTAVDDSSEMLAHVVGARTICTPIANLALTERFESVLLLSHLINSKDPLPLVQSASSHLTPDGVLVIERFAPGRSWNPSVRNSGPVTIRLSDIVRDGDRIQAVTTYELKGAAWPQTWELWERNDAEVTRLLYEAGLTALHLEGQWVIAGRRQRNDGS
ncbi:methyltransferase domain-containing protein [Epidermidibacterium keratini]|uniref:Methyltransferase domain-containing protein n=1 Tax=Epidermidibacterium keratini TaxID=1891644 RepID=A0A7L4YP82_9ACTN|nr:class I SAM-dependent methyltransferase [Epidermidibacterium keratini]QHC00956.1 methyltransferase domain-containing protein [Epidermidibacterium keratini]